MSSRDRLQSVLDDPIAALDGDRILVSSTDLADLIRQYDGLVSAVAKVARPSFESASTCKEVARAALRQHVFAQP